jgi:hypothetical protein
MPSVDDVLRDLADEGTATRPGSRRGELLITTYRGRPVEPPTRLMLNDRDLEALLARMATSDLRSLWPDVDRGTAAYYLFLTLLEEEMQRYDLQVEVLEVTSHDVRATPRSGWTRDLGIEPDAEGYIWTVTPPEVH